MPRQRELDCRTSLDRAGAEVEYGSQHVFADDMSFGKQEDGSCPESVCRAHERTLSDNYITEFNNGMEEKLGQSSNGADPIRFIRHRRYRGYADLTHKSGRSVLKDCSSTCHRFRRHAHRDDRGGEVTADPILMKRLRAGGLYRLPSEASNQNY